MASLKRSASAGGSLNGLDGSGIGPTTITREVTRQKLSPTSTALRFLPPKELQPSPTHPPPPPPGGSLRVYIHHHIPLSRIRLSTQLS